ncbi:MAG: FAD-dependent oxidoreductase [Minwuia sp.]|uniref:FAD-dependent oxidoreductase n=1 Tax=Minwuia sp. TaxID=2493630 RepID=UPI003A854AF2
MSEAALSYDFGQDEARETARAARVIVVGGGPCGVRAAQGLSARGHDVTLFSAEAFLPYNRVKLTPLLAGDVQIGDIALPAEFPGPGRVTTVTGLRVTQILPDDHEVLTADGRRWGYDALVLATGSRAHVPAIEGIDRNGIYVFRSAADVSALIARSLSARSVVVIGGGLLGLEAARGMHRRGARVHVVEHENRLMPRQLDVTGGQILADNFEEIGIDIRTGLSVQAVEGEQWVTGVRLRGGEVIECDTVIVCTGVRAETSLAAEAGLPIGRGIVVDDVMQTRIPGIYAVGECAEHREQVVGLVGPGLEQAEAAVRAIAGEEAAYRRGTVVAKLKLAGTDVFSIGPVEQLEAAQKVKSFTWYGPQDAYRRIFVEQGVLVGAIAVGQWDEAGRLQQAVAEGLTLQPWMRLRFQAAGRLWQGGEPDPAFLPDAAVACNCTGVTCGRIRACAGDGGATLEAVRVATGANTVCGSCGPLVAGLIGGQDGQKVRHWKVLLPASAVAALGALATLSLPSVPIPDTYGPTLFEKLWVDTIWKQWSGYILLGLTVAALLLGLRKRFGAAKWAGGFDWWRLIHIVLGVVCVAGLFAHTGFRLGSNLNSALMLCYLATLALGAVAGLATGGEHWLRKRGIGSLRRPPRRIPAWLHILAIWPIPVLLAAHVASVYLY